jgi:hypothetical protein
LGAIFDSDYFCPEEVYSIVAKLKAHLAFVSIHPRKEIENFLLLPDVLDRCVARLIRDRQNRTGRIPTTPPPCSTLLDKITLGLRDQVEGELIAKAIQHFHRERSLDNTATVTARVVKTLNQKWAELSTRLEIVPGKVVLAKLNESLQRISDISLMPGTIISETRPGEIPPDLESLLNELEEFRVTPPPEKICAKTEVDRSD